MTTPTRQVRGQFEMRHDNVDDIFALSPVQQIMLLHTISAPVCSALAHQFRYRLHGYIATAASSKIVSFSRSPSISAPYKNVRPGLDRTGTPETRTTRRTNRRWSRRNFREVSPASWGRTVARPFRWT